MTKDKPRKIAENQFKSTGVTGPQAWELMDKEKIPTLAKLRARLAQDGHKISVNRLSVLLGKVRAYLDSRPDNNPGRKRSPRVALVLQIVQDAADMEASLRVGLYRGVRVALMSRLIEAAATLKIDVPDEFFRGVECDARLHQIIHDLRGAEISNGAGKVSFFDTPAHNANGNGANRIIPLAPFSVPKSTQ